jgi:hypothetical protein
MRINKTPPRGNNTQKANIIISWLNGSGANGCIHGPARALIVSISAEHHIYADMPEDTFDTFNYLQW